MRSDAMRRTGKVSPRVEPGYRPFRRLHRLAAAGAAMPGVAERKVGGPAKLSHVAGVAQCLPWCILCLSAARGGGHIA